LDGARRLTRPAPSLVDPALTKAYRSLDTTHIEKYCDPPP
jgi:hypothetical protein